MGGEMDTGTSGDERVDEALGALKVLAETPVAGHVEIFEQVHRSLQDVLNSTDADDGPPEEGR
jgi:hypothetical protein